MSLRVPNIEGMWFRSELIDGLSSASMPGLYTAVGSELGAAGLQHQHDTSILHSKAVSRGIRLLALQPAFGASSVPGIPEEMFPGLRLYLDHFVCFNGVLRTSPWTVTVGAFVRHHFPRRQFSATEQGLRRPRTPW